MPVLDFLRAEEDLIVGRLSSITQHGISELSAEQLDAWRIQIPILREALNHNFVQGCHLLLEFPIPRRGKRIDAVVLSGSLVLVLEFKCGSKHYQSDAIAQVEDYCLDLRDFHKGSRQCTIVPVLIATLAKDASFPEEAPFDLVAPVWRSNAGGLGRVLEQVTARYGADSGQAINPEGWNNDEYLPTPTIIEAAQLLYEGKSVREVSRSHAGAENLTRTANAVAEAIQAARQSEQKVICFVTGVPGAGKTLAGLNIIHDRHLHEGTLGA